MLFNDTLHIKRRGCVTDARTTLIQCASGPISGPTGWPDGRSLTASLSDRAPCTRPDPQRTSCRPMCVVSARLTIRTHGSYDVVKTVLKRSAVFADWYLHIITIIIAVATHATLCYYITRIDRGCDSGPDGFDTRNTPRRPVLLGKKKNPICSSPVHHRTETKIKISTAFVPRVLSFRQSPSEKLETWTIANSVRYEQATLVKLQLFDRLKTCWQ